MPYRPERQHIAYLITREYYEASMLRMIFTLLIIFLLLVFLPGNAFLTNEHYQEVLKDVSNRASMESLLPSKMRHGSHSGSRITRVHQMILDSVPGLPQEYANGGESFSSRNLLSADNNTKSNSTPKYNSLTRAEKTSFTVGYTICFFVGFIGNILILLTIATSKELHNDINFLLCNIAIADILRQLTVIPYELFVIHRLGNGRAYIPALPGIRGDLLCKVMWSFPDLFIYVFVFTLVCMTCERFVAVVFPFHTSIFKGKSKWFIAGCWLSAVLLSFPMLYATKSMAFKSKFVCETDFYPLSSKSEAAQMDAYMTTVTVNVYVAFLVPFVIILVLNMVMACVVLRRNTAALTLQPERGSPTRGVTVMLATVSVVCALTSLPIQVYRFSYVYQKHWLHKALPVYFTFLLLFIAELSSMLNPWIYPLFVRRFREKYFKFLRVCFCQKKASHKYSSVSSRSTRFPNSTAHNTHNELLHKQDKKDTPL